MPWASRSEVPGNLAADYIRPDLAVRIGDSGRDRRIRLGQAGQAGGCRSGPASMAPGALGDLVRRGARRAGRHPGENALRGAFGRHRPGAPPLAGLRAPVHGTGGLAHASLPGAALRRARRDAGPDGHEREPRARLGLGRGSRGRPDGPCRGRIRGMVLGGLLLRRIARPRRGGATRLHAPQHPVALREAERVPAPGLRGPVGRPRVVRDGARPRASLPAEPRPRGPRLRPGGPGARVGRVSLQPPRPRPRRARRRRRGDERRNPDPRPARADRRPQTPPLVASSAARPARSSARASGR